jgi:hypothetical protein
VTTIVVAAVVVFVVATLVVAIVLVVDCAVVVVALVCVGHKSTYMCVGWGYEE